MRADEGGAFWDTVFDVVSLVSSAIEVVKNPKSVKAWASLAVDAACLIIPGVTGGGAIVKAASKLLNKADDVVDAGKAIDNAVDAGKAVGDAVGTAKKGWNVGDNITNLTKAGNIPSWSTVRQRYWKNEAFYTPNKYTSGNLDRMRKGLAPIGSDGFSMELHHPHGRKGSYYFVFEPLTRTDHMKSHYGGF